MSIEEILDLTSMFCALFMELIIKKKDGSTVTAKTLVRIDTENELDYFRNGGILHYVLRNLAREAAA